jgi:hypothetical protein
MSQETENLKQESGILNNTVNLFTSPSKAWEAIKIEGGSWFPLLVVIVMVGLLQTLYFQSVDLDWFIQQQVAIANADSTPAEKEAMISQMASLGRVAYTLFAVGGGTIGLLIMYALVAVLLLIISNIRDDKLTYGECFSLVSWSGVVKLISILIALVIISVDTTGQTPQHQLSGLNLNWLIFHLEPGHPWYNWLTQFDLIGLWGAVILGLGYHKFTQTPLPLSMIFGFLPTILYFGITALFI